MIKDLQLVPCEIGRPDGAIQFVEEPYDEHERELVRQIEGLQRLYEAAAKPLVDALARSRGFKPRSWIMMVPPR